MVTVYVAYHQEWGVFLGEALGLAFWSNLDPVGQTHAVTFDTAEEIHSHFAGHAYFEDRPSELEDIQAVPVQVLHSRAYASMQQCVNAGLPRWDPMANPEKTEGPKPTVKPEERHGAENT